MGGVFIVTPATQGVTLTVRMEALAAQRVILFVVSPHFYETVKFPKVSYLSEKVYVQTSYSTITTLSARLRILHHYCGAKSSIWHFLPFLRFAPGVHTLQYTRRGARRGGGWGCPRVNLGK